MFPLSESMCFSQLTVQKAHRIILNNTNPPSFLMQRMHLFRHWPVALDEVNNPELEVDGHLKALIG